MKTLALPLSIIVAVAIASVALAMEHRYSIKTISPPSYVGVVRLDRWTGDVTLCTHEGLCRELLPESVESMASSPR